MRHDLGQSDQNEQPTRYNFSVYRMLLIILVLVLMGLQYRLWFSDGSLAEVHRLKQQKNTLQTSVEQARLRNKALAAEIENLKSGREAMVGRARSDIGMVKEGETFYLTLPQNDSRQPPVDGTHAESSATGGK